MFTLFMYLTLTSPNGVSLIPKIQSEKFASMGACTQGAGEISLLMKGRAHSLKWICIPENGVSVADGSTRRVALPLSNDSSLNTQFKRMLAGGVSLFADHKAR